MTKVGRNQECPCGSGNKYKNCHENSGINFDNLNIDEWVRLLTVRGKNMYFVQRILEALQLDSTNFKKSDFFDFILLIKKSLTLDAVRKIYISITEIWPDNDDLNRCLEEEKDQQSGLYLGSYLFDLTTRTLNRHSMYDNSIILIDPLMDPRNVAPEYNPINFPEKHLSNTFHYILLWLQILPWIDQGIIKIIRDPCDFDYRLRKRVYQISEERYKKSPELKFDYDISNMPIEIENFFKEQYTLSHPDEFYLDKLSSSGLSADQIKTYLKTQRDRSLYYVENNYNSQLTQFSSGVNYEMGKILCSKTNSHIITDLDYRWKEMEYDRKENGVRINEWSALSKAVQESNIKYFNGLSFDDLLKLRNDGYLEDMRSFFRRLWNTCSTGNPLDKANVDNLSAELVYHIRKAETEWAKIDKNLVKWFGSESILGVIIGVVAGSASWLPAVAVATAGTIQIALSKSERNQFMSRFPAAFFIKNIRKKV